MEEVKGQVLNLGDALKNSLSETFGTVAGFLPKLVAALVIWIIGGFVARAVKWAAHKVLNALKFNDVADKVGINDRLKAAGLKTDATGMMSKLIYWIIMLTVYILVFNALGLEVVSDLLTSVIQYIPKIIVACILLIVGMFLADFVRDMVIAALKSGSFDNPNLVGQIAYFAVMFLAVTMAINTVGIGGDIVNTLVTSVFGALSLGIAIAFGLGGRDAAAKTINKITKLD